MDAPPPPPPPPPVTTTTATVTDHGSDPPTRVAPDRNDNELKLPLTTGLLTLHQLPMPLVVGYGKCRRNHAIGTGGSGLALDGCGEFIPTPISTPADLSTQKCIACGCHRSFHRCDVDHFHQPVQHIIEYQPHPHPHPHHNQPSNSPTSRLATMENSTDDSPDSSSPSPISSSYYPQPPYMFLNLNPGMPPPEPTTNNHKPIFTTAAASGSNGNGKKRFRSKFSEVQKEKMQELADRIGWKLQRGKEDMIVGSCNEIGVTKEVFKVWMHNHRNNKQGNSNHEDGGNATATNGSSSSF